MPFIVAPARDARNRFSQKIRQIDEWTVFVRTAVDFPVDVRYHLFVLGDETRGIVVTRPEVMRDVAAKIFDESDES